MSELSDNTLIEFHSDDDKVNLVVRLDAADETVWLNLNQIADLFERDKSVIAKHIKKIFKINELDRDSTVAYFAIVQEERGRQVKRNIEFFNLDVILAIGYRVNSQKGSEFRRWTSRVLKEYLLKGFSFNKERLLSSGISDVARSLDLLKQSLLTHGHVTDIGSAAIEIIRLYAKSWTLLNAFDENRLSYPQKSTNANIRFTEVAARSGIDALKSNLMALNEASSLFGNERQDSLAQIIGNIHQTFEGKLLYPSVYERAAHLFYFTIKDHPFTDGNKRIGSFFLLLYLRSYGFEINLSNEALIALALFVAQSQPVDKEIMIKLILNLITENNIGDGSGDGSGWGYGDGTGHGDGAACGAGNGDGTGNG
jgi:death-on-curing family protein